MADGTTTHTLTRKQFLRYAGAAGLSGLAGCSGGGDGGSGATETTTAGEQTQTKQTTAKTAEKEPLRIGYMSWLSGVLAGAGVNHRKAFDLRVEEINENGGVNGHELEAVAKDTKASPDTAIKRARELVTQEDVDVLTGLLTSASGKAMAEFAKSQGVPFLSGGAQTPDLTKGQCNEMVYRCTGNIISQMTALAEGVAKMTPDDMTTVAGINPDYVYGQQCWEVFKEEFRKRRPDVEYISAAFPAFQKGDYKKEIQKTLDAEPDIVHSVLYSGDMISFVKQAEQFGFFEQVPEFAATAVDAAAASLGSEWPAGVIASNPTNWNWQENQRMQQFTEKFVDRYGEVPTGFYAGYGETNAVCLKAAIEKGGGISTQALREGMTDVTFDTVATRTHIRPGDHQAFRETYACGRYNPVERDVFPDKDVMGWTEIVEVPGDVIREVDPDECEAF